MSKKSKTSSAGSMLIQSLPSLLKPKGSSKKAAAAAAKEAAISSGGSATPVTTTTSGSGKTKERREKESSSGSGNKSRESSSKSKKTSSKHRHNHHHNDNHVVVNGNATIGHAPSSAQTAGAPVDIRGRPIVRKKWRPLSYAEPGGSHKGRSSSVGSAVLQGSCFGGNSNNNSNSNNNNNNKSHGNNKNKISSNQHNDNSILINNNNNNYNNNDIMNDIDFLNETFDPRIITRLEADLFTMDQHYSKMYNGHSVRELEARLCQLKLQQLARRNSVDFAISCVEPHPMCYVEEVNKCLYFDL